MYLDELKTILTTKLESLKVIGTDPKLGYECGLEVYCSYHRDQILAALGKNTFEYRHSWREGVLFIEELKTDVFLINLNKTENEFSPTTMYEDYAINDHIFHWQSQSTTSDVSKTGKRYTTITKSDGESNNCAILFARVYKNANGAPMPYIFLGKGYYTSHVGSRPMSIRWKMENKMPLNITAYSPVGN